MNTLHCALSPEYIPHVDPTKYIPQDLMHLEMDGLLRLEFAYLVYSLVRVHGFCSLDQINASITSYPWPPGHKVPALSVNLIKGTAVNQPKSGVTTGITASQQLHLTLHR